MDCPWNLNQFGGDRPFIGLFEHRPQEMGSGKCFPAGHASAGYAWVGLYFFFKMIIPKYRWLGLLCGIMVGLTFGISQQLRGAHFISHDIVTILICWLIATLLFIFFSIKKYTVKMKNNSKSNIFNNIQKNRKGFSRVWHASKYSWSGIKDAWLEPAFRLEVILFVISLPLAQLIGRSMMEKLLLISCIWF